MTRAPSPVLSLAVLVLALAGAAMAQDCLPGQQPCGSTCCNTANNYTCCPYNGGFCAAPDQQCCESGPNGLCPKTSTCCDNGCANSTQECCQDDVCNLGECCRGSPENLDWFCRNETQQCCKGGSNAINTDVHPDVYPCDSGASCCSVVTSMYCSSNAFSGTHIALNSCCGSGTVCCPSFGNTRPRPFPTGREMTPLRVYAGTITACATYNNDDARFKTNEKLLVEKPRVRPGQRKLSDTVSTPCADPNNEFCCGGMACPTETLCCPGPDYRGYGDGCCYGYSSKDYACEDNDTYNSTCPTD